MCPKCGDDVNQQVNMRKCLISQTESKVASCLSFNYRYLLPLFNSKFLFYIVYKTHSLIKDRALTRCFAACCLQLISWASVKLNVLLQLHKHNNRNSRAEMSELRRQRLTSAKDPTQREMTHSLAESDWAARLKVAVSWVIHTPST